MIDELLLPTGSRLLHVGPPKTGTTAVQSALHQLRGEIEECGVSYPGEGQKSKTAIRELVGRTPRGVVARQAVAGADGPVGAPYTWAELVAEVEAAGDRRVCVSNEMFASADDEQAARAVTDLGGETVHVVMVARPIAPLLPSQWQQRVRKHHAMPSLDEWLRSVLGLAEPDAHHQHFWFRHDLASQIRRWSAATSPERVLVVVSREGDRSYLLRVFEQLLGLPDGLLDKAPATANTSLSFTQAELLRHLDHRARELGWDAAFHQGLLKGEVQRFLRHRPRGEHDRPVTLPEWATDRVEELTERRIRDLQESGARVIGDPETLRRPVPTQTREQSTAEPLVPVSVAAGALASAVEATLRDAERKRKAHRSRPAPAGLESASGGELAHELTARVRRRLPF